MTRLPLDLRVMFDSVQNLHFLFVIFWGSRPYNLCHDSVHQMDPNYYSRPDDLFFSAHAVCFIKGFELYSMVPSICPLETLHNSLSLKQVDDFLSSIAMFHDQVLDISASSPGTEDANVHQLPLNVFNLLNTIVLYMKLLLFIYVTSSCTNKESSFEHIYSSKGFALSIHPVSWQENTKILTGEECFRYVHMWKNNWI